MNTLIFRTIAPLLAVVMLLFSLIVLLRGHNAPGGGFIAGLTFLGGLMLPMMALGRAWMARRITPIGPLLALSGLGLAAGTGAASFFFGHPFLTSAVHRSTGLTSAFFFDLGVFFVVVGAGLMILRAFGEADDD